MLLTLAVREQWLPMLCIHCSLKAHILNLKIFSEKMQCHSKIIQKSHGKRKEMNFLVKFIT